MPLFQTWNAKKFQTNHMHRSQPVLFNKKPHANFIFLQKELCLWHKNFMKTVLLHICVPMQQICRLMQLMKFVILYQKTMVMRFYQILPMFMSQNPRTPRKHTRQFAQHTLIHRKIICRAMNKNFTI